MSVDEGHQRKKPPGQPLLTRGDGGNRAVYPLPPAQADRIAVGVCEHADPRTGCDLTWLVTLRGSGRQKGLARRVKVLDIGKGHRPAACGGGVESDLEAVHVVADVIRLIGMR